MVKVIKLFTLLLISIFLAGCGEDPCGYIPEGELPLVNIEIERMENEIFSLNTLSKVREFSKNNPVIAEQFLRKNEYPNDSIFALELSKRFNNPYIDTLKLELNKYFSDITWLEKKLEGAFSLMKYYYPEVKIPKVQTVATGFDYDLLVSDTLIIIGLDYYMGPEARFRPMGTYNYILKRYEKKYIVPSIMLLYGISSGFNENNLQDNSILAEMVSFGKSFYFAKRILPCTADSTLIWYTDKEMNNVKKYDYIAWGYFLENGLLYETSHLMKRKYLDERPQTYEITQFECPPRIATWLGWEIVKQYMDRNPDLTLQELMKVSDARKIFEDSKYRPKKR